MDNNNKLNDLYNKFMKVTAENDQVAQMVFATIYPLPKQATKNGRTEQELRQVTNGLPATTIPPQQLIAEKSPRKFFLATSNLTSHH